MTCSSEFKKKKVCSYSQQETKKFEISKVDENFRKVHQNFPLKTPDSGAVWAILDDGRSGAQVVQESRKLD